MTQQEQTQLSDLIERLIDVQAHAPAKTTYVMGRSDRSLSYELRDIIMELKKVANYVEPTATPEPESERSPEAS